MDEQQTPPCRVCGKGQPVLCYPDDTTQTICPNCCDTATHADGDTGHQWDHDRYEKDYECRHCGIYRRCTQYAWDD